MKILVTGGAGFIGSHLAERLLIEGHNVTVLDNFCSSKKSNISHLTDNDKFSLIEKDVINTQNFEGELDYILHLASRASPKEYQNYPIHTLRTNSEGTRNMVELAGKKDAKFLYSSTSEVYGDPDVHPQHEEYNGNVNPVGPRACYDEGKRYGEALITSYARQNQLDYRIIRIFNTYGPRMRKNDGRVITNFLNQAIENKPITVYGDGKQTRSFCYIDDLVKGIIKTMKLGSGEIVNLGNPEEIEIIELAQKVKEIIETDSEIIHKELPEDDPERRKPDISKVKKKTGWKPETKLEEGLEKTKSYLEK